MGTQTATIRATKPTINADGNGAWPADLNLDMDIIDRAINQTVTVNIADTNISLTADGTASDQALYLRYNFTGSLTADRTVTLPANVKVGWATNNTSGGHNVILSAGGTTLSLTDTSWTFFYCDGTNVTTPTTRLLIPQAGAASQNPLRADQAWQEIASYSLSGASSQAMSLGSFSRYRLTFQGLTVNTSTAFMECRFSSNGGVSYIASGYAQFGFNNTGSSMAAFDQTGTSALLTIGLSTAANSTADGVFEIYPGTASLAAMMNGRASFYNSSASWTTGQFSNALIVSGAVNAIEVFPSGGTFSGTIIVEGLP